MVETHKKEKNAVITKITLTISNGEHIKHTLSTSKHDRRQQHFCSVHTLQSVALVLKFTFLEKRTPLDAWLT